MRFTTRLSPSWVHGAKADGNDPGRRVAHPAAIARSALSFIGMGTLRPYRGSMSPQGRRRDVIALVARRPMRKKVACAATADIGKEGAKR